MGTALMIVQGVKLRRELRWQIGTGPITFSSGSRPRSLDLRRILIQNWQTTAGIELYGCYIECTPSA
jgi:hypothetical protein